MAKNLYLKKRNFAERYQVEQKVHIVDFVKDKSFMGKTTSKTDTLLICRLDAGYNISISFSELKSQRYGINICL